MNQATIAIIILAVMFVLFVIQKLPLGMVAVLCGISMAIFGIIRPNVVVSKFGSDTIMLLVGTSVMSSALFKTGFADILGSRMLNIPWVGQSERRFIFVLILVVAFVSAFMSNTATVAIFLPLIAAVAAKSGGRITKKGTYMIVGIAAIAGGSCTLPGSTPQMNAQGFLEQAVGQGVPGVHMLSVFELAKVGVPLVAIMLAFYLTVGVKLQNRLFDFPEVPDDEEEKAKVAVVEHNKAKMWMSGITLFACILAFVFKWLSIGTVSLLGAVVVVFARCIGEKDAYRAVPWNAICMIAGSTAVGSGLEASGAVELIVNGTIHLMGGESASPFIAFAAVMIVSFLLTQIVANIAVVACVVPIAVGLALAMSVNPMPFVIGAIFSCQWAYVTPVGAVPLTMTMVGGYRFKDYFMVSGIYGALCLVASLFLIPLFYPF